MTPEDESPRSEGVQYATRGKPRAITNKLQNEWKDWTKGETMLSCECVWCWK